MRLISVATALCACVSAISASILPVTVLRNDSNLIVFDYGNPQPSEKIVGIDFDGTLGIASAWENINITWGDCDECKMNEWVVPGTK